MQAAPAGLSAAEAAARLAREGDNTLPDAVPQPLHGIVLEVLREPMFLLLLAAAAMYLLLGDLAEALFLLGSVLVVIGLAVAQERRTRRALEALRDLAAPRALVVRDGVRVRVAGREVVRGDLLALGEGDRIAADAVLLDGTLAVDESALTGESAPVQKLPGPEDAPLGAPGDEAGGALFAGTLVTRGRGLARVRATGAATRMGAIGGSLASIATVPTALQHDAARIARVFAVLGGAAAVALALLSWAWNGRPLLDSVLTGLALAMAVLPAEIPMVLTVMLALGAWRMSRRQVLVRRAQAVEALGGITVLAVDKTGTLTANRMRVAALRSGDTHWDSGDGALPSALHELATVARLASPREPVDPMEVALRDFALAEAPPASLAADAPVHEYALTPRILAMTRVYGTPQTGRHLLATKGAPEAVIALCRLPDAQAQALRAQVEQLAAQGLRMLAVATGAWDGEAGHWPAAQDGLALRFVGLVGLADPPRPDVPAAVQACREAGVRVLMLTGDHPATAVAIARALGLPHARVLTGAQVDGLDDAALAARLAATDLCARLQPAHKLRLVRCLQADGERVGMTGDGVNDAPALVAADVGIAMGLRGTDVAREASDLVLLDDGFASIVEAIRHGRRVRANLRAAMRFIFAIHVPVVALALGPALLRGPLLLLPAHIVLLELLIDPFCSLLFEAQPGPADLMRRPPAQWSRSPFAVPNLARGLLQGAGVAAALLAGAWLLQTQGWPTEAVRTAVLLGLVAAVALLARAQLDGPPPAGRARGWTLAPVLAWGVLVVAIAGWPAMRRLMGLAPLGAEIAGATALLVATAALWIAAARRLARA